MKLSEETTMELLKAVLLKGDQTEPLPYEVGDKVFIRCVTHYQTGRVKKIVGRFLVLEDAAWIADTGRFSDALRKAEFDEVEPVEGKCIINTGAIVDSFEWEGPLPRVQK